MIVQSQPDSDQGELRGRRRAAARVHVRRIQHDDDRAGQQPVCRERVAFFEAWQDWYFDDDDDDLEAGLDGLRAATRAEELTKRRAARKAARKVAQAAAWRAMERALRKALTAGAVDGKDWWVLQTVLKAARRDTSQRELAALIERAQRT